MWQLLSTGGGGGYSSNFLVGIYVQVFRSKVSGTDFVAWNWGLRNKFLLKFGSQELNLAKIRENWAWKCKFRKNISGVYGGKKGLKWWVSRANKMAWKRESWRWHIPVVPSNVSAPHVKHTVYIQYVNKKKCVNQKKKKKGKCMLEVISWKLLYENHSCLLLMIGNQCGCPERAIEFGQIHLKRAEIKVQEFGLKNFLKTDISASWNYLSFVFFIKH